MAAPARAAMTGTSWNEPTLVAFGPVVVFFSSAPIRNVLRGLSNDFRRPPVTRLLRSAKISARGERVRVLVAGSAGAIGAPTVRLLAGAGYEVFGTTRSVRRAGEVRSLGAEPVILDALDVGATEAAFDRVRPECVVHLLTALPAKGARRASELEPTNRLRTHGTSNLVDAAVAAGVRRIVAESMILGYGSSSEPRPALTEDQPFGLGGGSASAALRSLEDQVLEANRSRGLEGIVLRYGLLYGPSVGSTEYLVRMLRRRLVPLPGRADGVGSWIHAADAATATVAALERGEPGTVYNVADDEPVAMRSYLEEMARAIGAPAPPTLPEWLVARISPSAARWANRHLAVSNQRLREHLRVTPAFPTYREGLADVGSRADT